MLLVDAGNNCVNIGTTTNHGGEVNIETTGNATNLALVCTDTDANAGPFLDLTRDNSSAADSDQVGVINFRADNSANTLHTYANIGVVLGDVTDGTEDGTLNIQTIMAGTSRDRMTIRSSGVVFNEESQDTDFRIESDGQANMLFVDGGNNHVNINTGSDRGGLLNIESGNNDATLVLACSDTDANVGPDLKLDRIVTGADNDFLGRIDFRGGDNAGNLTQYCQIETEIRAADNGSEAGRLNFRVVSKDMTSGAPTKYQSMIGKTGFGSAETCFNEDSNVIDFRIGS